MYEYDVFISYRRVGANVPVWVRTHFYPRLRDWLDDYVDHEVKIFLDDSLPTGTLWPSAVKDALLRSKVLIPVCSPKYFVDEWCLAEWHSMARREELVGGKTPLIHPVIFCDSENFPRYAHERKMRSFATLNQPSPQYQDSLQYLDFHRAIENLAEELVGILKQAPDWQSDWPVDMPKPTPLPPTKLPRF